MIILKGSTTVSYFIMRAWYKDFLFWCFFKKIDNMACSVSLLTFAFEDVLWRV